MADRFGENSELRKQAEAMLKQKGPKHSEKVAFLSPQAVGKVLHELDVQQIELEMQNLELRRSEARLAAERAHYFEFYDLAPVGYLTLSAAGMILEANLTAATLLGETRAELLNRPLSRFIFKEDQDRFYLFRKRLALKGKPQEWDLRLVKGDGSVFWAHFAVTAVADGDSALACRVVLSDISERRRVEAALQRSEERMQLVLIGSTDASWDWDLETNQRYHSPRWWGMLGYDVEELPNDAELMKRLLHPADQARAEEAFALSLKRGSDSY